MLPFINRISYFNNKLNYSLDNMTQSKPNQNALQNNFIVNFFSHKEH